MLHPESSLIDRVRHWLYPHMPYIRRRPGLGQDAACPRQEWRARVLGPISTWPGYQPGIRRYRSPDEADAEMQAMEAAVFEAARRRQPFWRRWMPTRFWRS